MKESFQLIQLTTEELKAIFGEVIKTQLDDVKKHLQPKEPNRYLTRQDVANMLQIDLSSVWNWTNKGILKPHQISGRVYYKLDEVENAIVELKKVKR